MFLKYGNYQHASAEASVAIERLPLFNERGLQYGLVERWTIDGELQAASQSALTTAINDLVAAYSTQGQDIGLFFDDGSATSHGFLSRDTTGGTRVVRVAFPEGRGAEYGTFRTYQITVEGEVKLSKPATLSTFSESITFTGGGPRFVIIPTLNGPPQKQLVNQATPFSAVQEGRAMNRIGTWPAPPGPIWPGAEHRDLRRIQRHDPRNQGGTFVDYEVTWSYVFESATVLAGNPHAI